MGGDSRCALRALGGNMIWQRKAAHGALFSPLSRDQISVSSV